MQTPNLFCILVYDSNVDTLVRFTFKEKIDYFFSCRHTPKPANKFTTKAVQKFQG